MQGAGAAEWRCSEYSDALMNRWRTTAKLVHNAEHALERFPHAELRQHSEQVDEVFELVFAGSGLIDRSVTKLLNHRLVDDVSARVKGLQLLVQQLDRRPIKSSEQSRVQQQVMDDAVVHAQKLMERLPSDPAAITALLEGIVQEARRVTEIAQRRIKTAEFAHRDAKRSIGRARDRLRQAASEAKGFNQALTAARQAVDHMILMTWTAHGLCMVEHKQAVKSEEKWRTERTLNDAKALKDRADRLEAEQLKGEALDVEAHIARLRKSKKMLDEGVVTAGERIESLLSWRDDPTQSSHGGRSYLHDQVGRTTRRGLPTVNVDIDALGTLDARPP